MFRDHLPRLTLARAVALALLLLLAQGLGLSHGVAHAQRAPAQHSRVLDAAAATGLSALHAVLPEDAPGETAWGNLHHAGEVECRLIDQLGHVDGAAPGPQTGLPAPRLARVRTTWLAAAPLAQRAAPYLARGPPR